MKKKVLAGIAAFVALLVGGVAFASRAERCGGDRAKRFVMWRLDSALDELDATDAQRATANQLASNLLEEGKRLKASKEAMHAEVLAQVKSDKPDANAVHAMVDRMLDDVRGFAHRAADAALTLHQTLTPEQRSQVARRMEKRLAHHGH